MDAQHLYICSQLRSKSARPVRQALTGSRYCTEYLQLGHLGSRPIAAAQTTQNTPPPPQKNQNPSSDSTNQLNPVDWLSQLHPVPRSDRNLSTSPPLLLLLPYRNVATTIETPETDSQPKNQHPQKITHHVRRRARDQALQVRHWSVKKESVSQRPVSIPENPHNPPTQCLPMHDVLLTS